MLNLNIRQIMTQEQAEARICPYANATTVHCVGNRCACWMPIDRIPFCAVDKETMQNLEALQVAIGEKLGWCCK